MSFLVPGTSPWCEASVLGMLFTSTCSMFFRDFSLKTFTDNSMHFLVMLVAVNLQASQIRLPNTFPRSDGFQLTVVHNINTTGYAKWYFGSSLLASIITCVPGAATHAWGYDTFFDICWLVSPNPTKRVSWLLGTTYTWTLLSAAVAFVSAIAVLFSLAISKRRTYDAF
jgi:hypothetical protein